MAAKKSPVKEALNFTGRSAKKAVSAWLSSGVQNFIGLLGVKVARAGAQSAELLEPLVNSQSQRVKAVMKQLTRTLRTQFLNSI